MRQVVTLKDVAAAAKVHYSTASRALDPNKRHLVSQLAARRVDLVAKRLGYRHNMGARSLRRGQTNAMGVIVPDLENPVWAPMLHGISGVLEASGFVAMIGETRDDATKYRTLLEKFAAWPVDAVITAASRTSDLVMLREFRRRGLPMVLVVRSLPGSGFATVSDDSFMGAAIAAEHLLNLGHRRLLQLVGPIDVQSFNDRSSGFLSIVAAHGAKAVGNLDPAKQPTRDEGFRLMSIALTWRGSQQPTAVFAHNDQMAIGALAAIRQSGRECPADISVVGYNDSPMVDLLTPPLTTVSWPAKEFGLLAGEISIRLISHPGEKLERNTVRPSLVVRSSTAPPPVNKFK
jgi:LacI family transcriptional regulator